MTLGSKIKRKLNSIGSKIQDGYNRIGGKKALLGGALTILGASAAGILSHSLNEFIHKPLESAQLEARQIKNSEYVTDALDDAFDGGVYGLGPNKLVDASDFPSVPSSTPSLASLQARYRTFGPSQQLHTSAVPMPPVYTLPYIR